MAHLELPIPPHFKPDKVGEVWKVSYQETAEEATSWAKQHNIKPAANDRFRIFLVTIDVQNTFCIPGFELFVGGRSGSGAVDDNRRLCRFIYRNLDVINQIAPTMDTHKSIQIFHSIFLVNAKGEHPAPLTLISEEEIKQGLWRINPNLCHDLQIDEAYGQRYLQHYINNLRKS
ncbi:MAG: isochorismatase, partial [Thermodesulfobacteriota bacterium]|nr:isochorismatase [Thermodesulfobacteriota bacterium]